MWGRSHGVEGWWNVGISPQTCDELERERRRENLCLFAAQQSAASHQTDATLEWVGLIVRHSKGRPPPLCIPAPRFRSPESQRQAAVLKIIKISDIHNHFGSYINFTFMKIQLNIRPGLSAASESENQFIVRRKERRSSIFRLPHVERNIKYSIYTNKQKKISSCN